MPIRARLALAFALVTLALVSIGGLLFVHSFRSGLVDSLGPGLRNQAGTLARRVRDQGAAAAIGDAQGGPTGGRDIVAQVLDGSGGVLATTREAGTKAVVSPPKARAVTRGGVFAEAAVGGEREPYRVLAVSTETSAGRRVVLVATSLEATDEAVARVRDALLIGGASAVLLAAIGGWFLSAAALRPVERMRRQTAEISAHEASSRLEIPGTRDELAALAATMNELLDRLHAASSRQRDFVADASHELRTPLAVLRTELELADRPQRTDAERRDALHHAINRVEALARLTEDLLLLASADDGAKTRLELVRVETLVEGAVASVFGPEPSSGARVVDARAVVDAEDVEVRGVPSLLRRAVENLLENARRYAPRGSTVTVVARRVGATVTIEVADHGPGFTPAFLPHAFERFRRADEARARVDGGTGLGLAIVRAVAEMHGGTATATNGSPSGAIVTMTLPLTG